MVILCIFLKISSTSSYLNLTVTFSVLFDHYFDSKHEDEPNVEDAYKEFCHSLLDVDPFQIDEIMGAAAFLCMEHERAAFNAGAKVCAYLLRELSE